MTAVVMVCTQLLRTYTKEQWQVDGDADSLPITPIGEFALIDTSSMNSHIRRLDSAVNVMFGEN